MIRKNDLAGRALAVIRLFNGAGALFVPETALKRLGGDPAHDGSAVYPLRMFGVRTVVLGAELLLPQERDERLRAMRTGILIHASDTLAAAAGGVRRQLPPATAALLTAISAVNTALAIVGSTAPRRGKARRRWLRW